MINLKINIEKIIIVKVGYIISRNSEKGTSKNLYLLKNHNHTGKNCKANYFRTLKINQRPATIRRVLTQLKYVNINNDNKLSDVLTSITSIPTSLDPQYL